MTSSTRKLGRQGLEVSAIGFGCDEGESIATLYRAIIRRAHAVHPVSALQSDWIMATIDR